MFVAAEPERTVIPDPVATVRVARTLSDLCGKTVHTICYGGFCRPLRVAEDGSLTESPYRIEECTICEMPGPHPHLIEQMVVDHQIRQEQFRKPE